MNRIFACLICMFMVSNVAFAGNDQKGPFTDPCVGPNVVENSWLIAVNEDDSTSREGLLEVLDLMSTGGFSVRNIFSYDQYPTITISLGFDHGYWVVEKPEAERIKNQTLGSLSEIEGVIIYCDQIVGHFR